MGVFQQPVKIGPVLLSKPKGIAQIQSERKQKARPDLFYSSKRALKVIPRGSTDVARRFATSGAFTGLGNLL